MDNNAMGLNAACAQSCITTETQSWEQEMQGISLTSPLTCTSNSNRNII